jgi:tetratricopeptide (TPR) repeat protein
MLRKSRRPKRRFRRVWQAWKALGRLVVLTAARPVVWLVGVLGRWFRSRRFRRLLIGSPALIVLGVVVAAVVWHNQQPQTAIVDRYRLAAGKALQQEDLVAAELYLRKLLQLNANDFEARYSLALVASEMGDQDRAEQMMSELATHGTSGYARAHLWLASRMSAGKKEWTKEEVTTLVRHLRSATKSPETAVAAHAMLAQVYAAAGDHANALDSFNAIVSQRPELRLSIAQLLFILKRPDEAKMELGKAISHFDEQITRSPDDIDARIALARAVYLTGDLPRVEKVLRQRFGTDDEERCRYELASLIISHSDRALAIATDKKAATAARVELLQAALECSPESPEALNRLAAMCFDDSEASADARLLLKDALAAGRAPATVHLILGTTAAQHGRQNAAKLHLEQAYRMDPEMPVVLNNLAWHLTTSQPPDLDRAIQLVDAAIDAWPKHPEFRATRGHVLVGLERWQDALVDLEIALRDLGERDDLHESLATAYSQLGDEEQAQKHLDRISGNRQSEIGDRNTGGPRE